MHEHSQVYTVISSVNLGQAARQATSLLFTKDFPRYILMRPFTKSIHQHFAFQNEQSQWVS